MKRAILFVLVVLMVSSVSGCKTVNSGMVIVSESALDNDQLYLLQTWDHNAVLSEEVGDYPTAIMYYSKIVENFPNTKKAAIARKKLNVLNKAH